MASPATPSICLGVDPGSLACGWAVVSRLGSRMELLEAGVIRKLPENYNAMFDDSFIK